MKKLVIFLFCMVMLVGCTKEEELTYKTISASAAHDVMENNSDVIVLDVRSVEEFNSSHIENAVNIPYTDIESRFESEVTSDKDATILVYCQSGQRSTIASETLVKLGYTNVNNFGGLNNWKFELSSDN